MQRLFSYYYSNYSMSNVQGIALNTRWMCIDSSFELQ